MIVLADGKVRYGWAIKHPDTGYIYLHEICEDAESAHALMRGMAKHQSHRRGWKIVRVALQLSLIDDAG